ncbi:hypothetical protein FQ377_14595 [Arthrobacter echini]|uniref:Uncharacterized protein n=1 Tax=Arthrobacter echini TaxID=1529066 RepID=A0A5D0XI70_9MICC|nr:hypothetical protein [Arthrobacter echini]TYC95856.1 hypothetical protein FQ377_14595 [Arthrobacter echini]
MPAAAEMGATRKEQLLRQLHREILAARLKVTLDRELGRETSSAVRSLARIKLPLLVSEYGREGAVIEKPRVRHG